MAHGFHGTWAYLLWLAWMGILAAQMVRAILAGRRAALREQVGARWPCVPGTVRGAWAEKAGAGWKLALTYHAFESGHGIDTWAHGFLTKPEAEHAARVLSGRACTVHYNPERDGEMTLVWSEVQKLLAQEPYVPRLEPLGRVGYRWVVGLAAVAVSGLVGSMALVGIGMSGSSLCVCEAMAWMMFASVLVGLASLVPMGRMMMGAPRVSGFKRLKFVLTGWGLWAMGAALVGTAMSLAHYGPMFRALAMDADVPNKVLMGTIGVVPIPVFLFAALVSVGAARRLRPVTAAVAVEVAA